MSADKSTRGALTGARESRSYPARYEVRAQAGTRVEVTGYASTVEQPYEMHDAFGAYSEVVRAGAFGKTLSDGADVAFLANHGGTTLARSKSGTLALSEDSTGLLAVATLNTARGDARDLVTAIEDGDVDEMSFAFRVVRQAWSPDYDERSLTELDINRGDVSAVNFGANPQTSIAAAYRSAGAARLHSFANELRAGKAISAANAEKLAQALDLIAQADDGLDQAQPILAELLGVPNPDDDEKLGAPAAPELVLPALLALRDADHLGLIAAAL